MQVLRQLILHVVNALHCMRHASGWLDSQYLMHPWANFGTKHHSHHVHSPNATEVQMHTFRAALQMVTHGCNEDCYLLWVWPGVVPD